MDTSGQVWFDAYATARGTALRQSSRDLYGARWKQYVSSLSGRGIEPALARSGEVATFLAHYTGNTAIRYYRLLRGIYDAALEAGLCKQNPLVALSDEYEHEEERVTVSAVPTDTVERLYSIKPGRVWKKLRDRVLVLVAAEAGLRRGELLDLQVTHLRLGAIPPKVQAGKASGRREVELSARLATELRTWLDRRAKEKLVGNLVFPAGIDGTALNPSTAYRIIEKHLDQVGAGRDDLGKSGARVLRASLAHRQDAAGVQLPEMKKVLGHRQLMSTAEMVKRVLPPAVPEPENPASSTT